MTSPFKFLDSYTKEDKEIFFGRDREIEELYQKVYESKILLVYGISGTGKSSLIYCGLAGKFSDSDWLPVNIRRGGNMTESVARSLSSAAITPFTLNTSKDGWLKKGIRSLYLDHFKPVYLIFDQFEELFIFGSKTEKEEFIKAIKEVTESDLQCRFLFVIREEYLAGITEFEKQIPTFLSNRIRIEKMTRSNAQHAIEGPCRFAGIDVEQGFADQLLDRLSPEGVDVELTYLQVFLDKIFKVAKSENPGQSPKFTLAQLKKTGEVKDLLGSFLEEQIVLLPDPDTALVALKAFVSTKGTKRQITEEEVLDYSRTLGKNLGLESLRDLIQRFINLRILRDKDESGHYELRHDALASKIYEKITLVEKELLEVRQFIENAYDNFIRRKILLNKSDLSYIAPYEGKIFLNEQLNDFIFKSKREAEKAKRRRRIWLFASMALLIALFSGFSIWALNERAKAVEKEKIALENEKMANREKQKALEAMQEADRAKAELETSNVQLESQKKEVESAYKQSKINEVRAVSQEKKTKALFLTNMAKDYISSNPTKALRLAEYALMIDPANSYSLEIRDSIYAQHVFYQTANQNTGNAAFSAITSNGEKIYLSGQEGPLKVFSSSGSKIKDLMDSDGSLNSLKISENYIIAAFSDMNVKLWNQSGEQVTTLKMSFEPLTAEYNEKSDMLLVCGKSGNVYLTNLKNENPVQAKSSGAVNDSKISPNGQFIVVCQGNGGYLWDQTATGFVKVVSHSGKINYLSFHPNGKQILTASDDQTAVLWDLSGRKLSVFKHNAPVTFAMATNDGKYFLTGTSSGSICIWNQKEELVYEMKGHTGAVSFIGFAPDKKTIISGSKDKTIRSWKIGENDLDRISASGKAWKKEGYLQFRASGKYDDLSATEKSKFSIKN